MKKIIDYVLSSIYLIHFGLTLLVFHIFQVVAFHVFGKKAHKAVVDYLNFTLTFGLYLTGARITLRNLSDIPDNRTIIFVANTRVLLMFRPYIGFCENTIPALYLK
jgi:1-acyl-sn-glycerol-3-phosphate acyltransferase